MHAQGRFLHAATLGLLPNVVLAAGQLLGPSDIRYLATLFVGGYLLGGAATIASVVRSLGVWGVRPSYRRVPAFFSQFLPLVAGAGFPPLIFVPERALASPLHVGALSPLRYRFRTLTVLGGPIAPGF